MEINDKEIADWVNDCPTHKIEVLYSDENGIQLLVNFNNEKEDKNEQTTWATGQLSGRL